jgi:hypothetical protein
MRIVASIFLAISNPFTIPVATKISFVETELLKEREITECKIFG